MRLLDDFRSDLELRRIGTIDISMTYAGEFCAFLEGRGKKPAKVDREDLKAFLSVLRTRGLKFRSQERVFSTLSQFYSFMVEEGKIKSNPILPFTKRYLRQYKEASEPRQLISVEDAARLVNSVLKSRDRAMLMLLLKTGMRRGELQSLDVSDIDMKDMSLVLKPTAKRSNRMLFFDYETAEVLQSWLNARPSYSDALFPTKQSGRLGKMEINRLVEEHAARAGLHDPTSKKLQDRFTPHCARHWLITHLLRAGMPRDYVKWLRGDAMREAIDIYYHIDAEDVRKSYLAHVPQLGV